MANYWFEETFDPSGGNQGGTSIRGGQRIIQTFDCHTDDPLASVASVLGALAAYLHVYKGRPHYLYSFARCTDIAAVRDPADPAFRWLVTATYEEPAPVPGGPILGVGVDGFTPETTPSGTTGGGHNQPQPTPANRAPLPKVAFRKEPFYETTDLDGLIFQNSAGDPFDPPPPLFKPVALIALTTWKDVWNVTIGKSFFNTTNLTSWQGFAAYRCVVEGLDAQMKTESGLTFWELAWQVAVYDVDMRYARIPDYGWNLFVSGVKKPAKDVYGQNLASPVKLDGAGGEWPVASPPVIILRRIRQAVEFNVVGGVGGL